MRSGGTLPPKLKCTQLSDPGRLPHACLHAWEVASIISNFATLWTVACQAPLSMGFSRHNTGVGCPALLQEIFQTQGQKLCLKYLLHWLGGFFITGTTWEAQGYFILPSICPCHSLCLEYPCLSKLHFTLQDPGQETLFLWNRTKCQLLKNQIPRL